MARERSGLNMVPTMNGMLIRESPIPWLTDCIPVGTTVATKPQSSRPARPGGSSAPRNVACTSEPTAAWGHLQ